MMNPDPLCHRALYTETDEGRLLFGRDWVWGLFVMYVFCFHTVCVLFHTVCVLYSHCVSPQADLLALPLSGQQLPGSRLRLLLLPHPGHAGGQPVLHLLVCRAGVSV